MGLPVGPIPLLFRYIQGVPGVTATDVALRFFIILAIMLVVSPFHEFAHAWSAKKLGDDTAERMGRLTLNPIVHIDPIGAIMKLFFCFGWAKPVPIDPRNADRKVTQRGFIALTAAAGPASNILFSLVFIIIGKVMALGWTPGADSLGMAINAVYMMAQISVYLAVFNLIPLPPLDGSKILYFFLNNRQVRFFETNQNIIRIGFLILIFTGVIGMFIGTLSNFVLIGLDWLTFFIK